MYKEVYKQNMTRKSFPCKSCCLQVVSAKNRFCLAPDEKEIQSGITKLHPIHPIDAAANEKQ